MVASRYSQWRQGSGSGEAPSVEEVYTPATLPGLGAQPIYLHTQATAALDWRTAPGYARRGGSYGVTVHDFADPDSRYGFRQVAYDAIQHVPVLREVWVLSFHGRVETTSTTFLVLLGPLAAVPVFTASLRFYSDDPIAREPDPENASGVQPWDIGLLYELSYNLFVTSAHVSSDTRAGNINTIDEVPDSSWFTNRVGAVDVPVEQMVRGPNLGPPPAPEKWVLIRENSAGVSPGFTAKDAQGQVWFISFDPPGNPEGATASVVIASKIFWALGYNQVESFITTVDPKRVEIDPTATIRRPSGARTPLTRDDLAAVLERAAPNADGTYRAVAARSLSGKVLGGFRYGGTRPDGPNDIVPHEHRRELRALRVFGAWTNLTDLEAGNTLDVLVTESGHSVVRHYLQDVGSTFGMANGFQEWSPGWDYFYEAGAARRVHAFSDDEIRAIVHTGQFSDPAAERYLASMLIMRRDKIAQSYLPAITPVVNPRLDSSGSLAFDNAAVLAGVAEPPAEYHAAWSRFDNATGETHPIAETRSASTTMEAPYEVESAIGSYVRADLSADGAAHLSWKTPVRMYFRRVPAGWTLVGLERGGERPTSPADQHKASSGAQR